MKIKWDADTPIHIHSLESEMKRQDINREANRRLTVTSHSLIFHPKAFAREHEVTDTSTFALSNDQLLRKAQLISKVRAQLRARSLRLTPSSDSSEPLSTKAMTKLQRQMHRGFYAESREANKRKQFM